MEPTVLALSFVIIFTAGFLQGLVGFGSGLLSVPLLSFMFVPKFVVPLTLVHGLIMNMYLSARNRRFIQWKRVLPLLLTGLIGIPVGTMVLLFIPSSGLKIIMGAVISMFAILLLRGLSRKFKRERLGLVPVGLVSGILNGSISMSGPPVILFLSNQGVRKDRFRANLVTYFFLLNILTLIIFLAAGILTEEVLITAVILLPPLPLGILAGEYLSKRVSEKLFRTIALLLVLGTGISALMTGILGYF